MPSVLAVDDSAAIREMVKLCLDRAGYTVVQAEDGVDALTKAQKETVDLVLTDINMPNMDGIELIKQLRSLTTYKFIPILVLTTESATDTKMAGKNAGATGWIVKPFDPTTLIATIAKVLT